MKINSPSLFLEINTNKLIFLVIERFENNKYEFLHEHSVPIKGIDKKQIIDLDLLYDTIKQNIYSIEQKFNSIFSEVIIILDIFECSIINFTGFKNLNGTQLAKENITYILNSLKSKIFEFENQKTILHIFNSKYFLDEKETENMPIGLFGNFYSHELAFFLINKNDYKNLHNIFNKCNLKIKKIISKSFIEGANIVENNSNLETFIKIKIDKENSKIIFFENSSLKFFQEFNFGTDLIVNDISKITAIKKDIVNDILINSDLTIKSEEEFIEKNFFPDQIFRKIKKKLIVDIANARIQELSEVIIFKNLNFKSFVKKNLQIFLKINNKTDFKCLDESFNFFFSNKGEYDLRIIDDESIKNLILSAANIAQFGWKKEAVPIVHEKKSIIARLFYFLFG